MKKWLGIILGLLLMAACLPAFAAGDVFTVENLDAACDADAAYVTEYLTSDRSYLRLDLNLDEETPVNVSIRDEAGDLVYQRDYGLCAGHFRSEDIYLRLTGSRTAYQVRVQLGDARYDFPLRRVAPRITGEACSAGYPLAALNGGSSWKTVTLLDLAALEGSRQTVALCADGAYDLGVVKFSVSGGSLKVTAALDEGINGEISKATVYVATTAQQAQALGKKGFDGLKCGLGESIDLSGVPYAAVYVKMTVAYDPAGAEEAWEITLPGQDTLWQQFNNQ